MSVNLIVSKTRLETKQSVYPNIMEMTVIMEDNILQIVSKLK